MAGEKEQRRRRVHKAGISAGIFAVVIVFLGFFGLWLFTGWAWDVWAWLQAVLLAVACSLTVFFVVYMLVVGLGSLAVRWSKKPNNDQD